MAKLRCLKSHFLDKGVLFVRNFIDVGMQLKQIYSVNTKLGNLSGKNYVKVAFRLVLPYKMHLNT